MPASGRRDQAWLDYRKRSGCGARRKKERDGWRPDPWFVPLRYMLAFVTTITSRHPEVLCDAGVTGDELRRLEDAWAKTIPSYILTLWARPYTIEGLW